MLLNAPGEPCHGDQLSAVFVGTSGHGDGLELGLTTASVTDDLAEPAAATSDYVVTVPYRPRSLIDSFAAPMGVEATAFSAWPSFWATMRPSWMLEERRMKGLHQAEDAPGRRRESASSRANERSCCQVDLQDI